MRGEGEVRSQLLGVTLRSDERLGGQRVNEEAKGKRTGTDRVKTSVQDRELGSG